MSNQIPAVRWNQRLIYADGDTLTASRKENWQKFDFSSTDPAAAWQTSLRALFDMPLTVIERITVLNSERLLLETSQGNFIVDGDLADGGCVKRDSCL